jgi:hypothetical protein
MVLPNLTPFEGITMVKILLGEDNASFHQSPKKIHPLKFPSLIIERQQKGMKSREKLPCSFLI